MKNVVLAGHLAASIAGLVFSGAALAQSTWSATWDWAAPCNPVTCTASGATGAITATVSAFGAETAAGNFAPASIYAGSNNYLGITSAGENTTDPNHSIDNYKTNTQSNNNSGGADYAEALLINFTQAVSLTQVAVSWTSTDSDAMIFRFDGGTGAQQDLLQVAANALPTAVGNTNKGWTLVKAGQFASSNSSGSLSFTSDLYSSYWLVSTAMGQSYSSGKNNDGFKVSSFTGNIFCQGTITNGTCKPPSDPGGSVPEPASLALAASGLLGLTISRRRMKRR